MNSWSIEQRLTVTFINLYCVVAQMFLVTRISQWLEAFAVKPDDLTSNPGTHTLKGWN